MKEEHKFILRELTPKIINGIQDPHLLSSYLPFTDSDREQIGSRQTQQGSIKAAQELLVRLMKRGNDAYEKFIKALRQSNIGHGELADEIKAEEISPTQSSPATSPVTSPLTDDDEPTPYPPGEEVHPVLTARGPWGPASNSGKMPGPTSPSTSNPKLLPDAVVSGAVVMEPKTLAACPPPSEYSEQRPLPPVAAMKRNPEEEENLTQPHQESTKSPEKLEPETLLKDIPSSLRDIIVQQMNIPAALGMNWRGIANKIGLNQLDVDTLETTTDSRLSRMAGLFQYMVQKGLKLQDLLHMLRECERFDVIQSIEEAGLTTFHSVEETVVSTTSDIHKQEISDDSMAVVTSPCQETEESTTSDIQQQEASEDGMTSPRHETEKSTTSDIQEEKAIEDGMAVATSPRQETEKSTTSDIQQEASEDGMAVATPPRQETEKSKTSDIQQHETSEDGMAVVTSPCQETEKSKISDIPEKEASVDGMTSPRQETEKSTTSDIPEKEANLDGMTSPHQEIEKSTTLDIPEKEANLDGMTSPRQDTEESMTPEDETIAGLPSEATENGEDDEAIPSATLDQMLADPDVFRDSEEIQRSFLIVECTAYKCLSKLDGIRRAIKTLRMNLSDWDASIILRKRDATASNLNRKVDDFVKEYGSDVCMVYLFGHTVQINGENYLLPTDVSLESTRADIKHLSLNINSLVQRLTISCLQVVIVDGAHHNEFPFTCHGVLPGLAPIIPPPNAVIAFPCSPGIVRAPKDKLLYLNALGKVLDEHPDILLADMFAKIRGELPSCVPVEFSLLTTLLPFSINPGSSAETDHRLGIVGLNVPTASTTWHALVLSNSKDQQYTHVARDTEHLRSTLLKLGWNKVTTYCNRTSSEMSNFLQSELESLSGEPLKIVMIYFIGAAKQLGEDNRLLGVECSAADIGSSVSTQWLIDLMCEYISGPKVLIVDDLQSTERGLKRHVAPQEFLISLPRERKSENRLKDQSYTLLFSQVLSLNHGKSSLASIVNKAARMRHNVTSNLFYA